MSVADDIFAVEPDEGQEWIWLCDEDREAVNAEYSALLSAYTDAVMR